MKKLVSILVSFAILAGVAAAADLSLEARIHLGGTDPAGNYFSFKTAANTVIKDQVDVVTGASKGKATAIWNAYRADPKGKSTFPYGIHSLPKFGVSSAAQFAADLPRATRNADGSITIEYLHRGVAYSMTTDGSGKLNLPGGAFKLRKVGYIDTKGVNIIHPDFSSDGLVTGLDYAKVWDGAIADGKVINGQPIQKTGKIGIDSAASDLYLWRGAIQITLEGQVLSLKGDLDVQILR